MNYLKLQVILFSYAGERRKLQKTLNESNFIIKENGIYEAYSFKIINGI